jgi:hypothetical protein
MTGPGPGQVVVYAEGVKRRRNTTPHGVGVRAALAWVLGEKNEHPLTNEASDGYPPNMQAITDVARDATASRKYPKLSSEYLRGVRDCLRWINGTRSREPLA